MTTPSQPNEGCGPSGPDRLAEHLSEIMPRLLALASHWLHGHIADSEDAADVVQDVLLKALQDGSFRRISEADLEAWLAVCIRLMG